MKTQTTKRLHLPLLGAGIAAILASGIAIASLRISAQDTNAVAAPVDAVAAPAAEVRRSSATRCKGCGVIESMQKIEIPDELIQMHAPGRIASRSAAGTPGEPAQYLITVRLQDGTTRVIKDAHPAKWRTGERVHLIAGLE